MCVGTSVSCGRATRSMSGPDRIAFEIEIFE
jgi:hypothetical protein